MDKLENYVIKHSSCGMPRCEYVENGTDIDCDECQRIMIVEHDAEIRTDSVKEFAEWLSNTEYVASQGHFILPLRGSYSVDEVVDIWEKEQKE